MHGERLTFLTEHHLNMAKLLVQKMTVFPVLPPESMKKIFYDKKIQSLNFKIERKGQHTQHWIIFRLDS